MFPFAKVPFWVPVFDPQPDGCLGVSCCLMGGSSCCRAPPTKVVASPLVSKMKPPKTGGVFWLRVTCFGDVARTPLCGVPLKP